MADQLHQLEYAVPLTKREWRTRRRGKPVYEFFGLSLSLVMWAFLALLLIGFVFGWFIGLSGPIGGFPSFLAGVLLIPTLAGAMSTVRRRRASAVLGYLQQAVRLNQPFNRVLGAASRSEKGRTTRRIAALKEDLEAGFSLGDALSRSVPEISLRTIGLIDYADKSGGLGEALNRLVAEDLNTSRQQRNDQAFAAWYPPMMIAVMVLFLGLVGTFVVPRFVQILKDFRIDVPPVTQWIIWASDWVSIFCPVTVAILFLCLGFQLRQAATICPPIWVFRKWRDNIAWRLPLLHRFILDRNMADISVALADSVQLGYPLGESLERLKHLDLNSVLQRRISNWADALRAGMSPADAARAARMPKLLVGMMAPVRDTADLGEVFAFVGRFHTDRFLLRREAMRAAVIPVFTLIMGVIVALIALSIFVPMQQMAAKYSW